MAACPTQVDRIEQYNADVLIKDLSGLQLLRTAIVFPCLLLLLTFTAAKSDDFHIDIGCYASSPINTLEE